MSDNEFLEIMVVETSDVDDINPIGVMADVQFNQLAIGVDALHAHTQEVEHFHLIDEWLVNLYFVVGRIGV